MERPERRLTASEPVARPPVGLYVHVPFCVSRCPYCDFVVLAGAAARGPRNRFGQYEAAVLAEVGLRADVADARFGPPGGAARPPLGSLYIGGGTPSLLGPDAVGRIVDRIDRRFTLAGDAEVSLEANPAPAERGDARAWRTIGIDRLSIGAQSMLDAEIRALGRRHSAADVASAVAEARGAGVRSVSLDLLYDVPGQTLETWRASLDAALGLQPDHLSLYALTLDDPAADRAADRAADPSSDHLPIGRGARRWRRDARARQDEDRAAAMYEMASERLAVDGWVGYEISNWARPGHESRHNLAYWRRHPVEAVGPGAHAFDGAVRRWNAAELDGYVGALVAADGSAPRLPPGGSETLDGPTAAAERLILGLRLAEGVPRSWADGTALAELMPWATATGLLAEGAAGFRLTDRGRLLSNEVFARLV